MGKRKRKITAKEDRREFLKFVTILLGFFTSVVNIVTSGMNFARPRDTVIVLEPLRQNWIGGEVVVISGTARIQIGAAATLSDTGTVTSPPA